MDARVRTIRDLFQSNEQYVVPFFQRSYAWKKKQRELLWDDIERLTEPESKATHFLGPVVCSAADHVPVTSSPKTVPGAVRESIRAAGPERILSDESETTLSGSDHSEVASC